MHQRQTAINAVMSVTQFVVLGAILFGFYRFLLNSIGIEKVGLWSVIVSITSASSVASLGLGGGIVRFVALYAARDDPKSVVSILETGFISLGIALGATLLVLYPVFKYSLSYFMPKAALSDVTQILAWAMVAFWLATLAQVFQSGLDGYQRIDLRSAFNIGNEVLYFLLCLLLVPRYGLNGLATAYSMRSCTMLLGSRLLLGRVVSQLPPIPHHWNRVLFHEMLRYGVSFQAISIAQMLLDPTTKALMARFGGLAMTGYYEMAYRMVVQLRGVLVSLNSVIVPVVADLQERNADAVRELYALSFKVLVLLGLPFYGLVIALVPSISLLWIGQLNQSFVIFSLIITLAYLVNTYNGPAYFTSLGSGRLTDNVVSHIIMGVLNALLGCIFGTAFGSYGVATGWGLAIIAGSLYLIFAFSLRENVTPHKLVIKEDGILMAAVLLALIASCLVYSYSLVYQWPPLMQVVVTAVIFLLVTLLPIWRHPMRGQIYAWLSAGRPFGGSA